MLKSAHLPWMVYGAYGVTGQLIVEEALRQGHRPLLAGRDAGRLEAMAQALGLEAVAVALDDTEHLHQALRRVWLVVHAVGPFAKTGMPMIDACLHTGTPYIDIAGEATHLRALAQRDGDARQAGVPLLGGAGFGATYGDCLARHVVDRLPDASHLQISVAAQTRHTSPAALRSMLAVLGDGGAAVERGRWVRRALAHRHWSICHEGVEMPFAAAPMGELVSAAQSTGVANILVGRPMPQATAVLLRWLSPVLSAASRLPVVQRFVDRRAAATEEVAVSEPAEPLSRIWAQARNARGEQVSARLDLGEGYAATAAAVVANVQALLASDRVGALTPAQAFGASHLQNIPGARLVAI